MKYIIRVDHCYCCTVCPLPRTGALSFLAAALRPFHIYRAAEWIYVLIFPRAEYALSAAGDVSRAGDIPAKTGRLFATKRLHLQQLEQIKAADKYNDAGFNSFFKTGWKRFYLKWYEDAHPSASQLCPQTTALLRDIPSVKAAMFATLPDGSRLPRHRDPYAGSLRFHLGLATPNDDRCFIEVDGQRYSWRDGEGVLFDETYIHYAENTSGENRLILFCDIERPMRYRWAQKVNHWLGRHLMSAASAPNDIGDRTGGINRAFRYIYQIRIVGKRLKKWNKTVYYIVKWLLFGGIAWLIWSAF